ncbi:MAG TPA: hypothetical protein PLG95_07925, partial [Methanoculleus sp.]|nr:hypothetical protein [Methanoculleus sp.]
SIYITVSPDTGLSPGTLGHLKRRDNQPFSVFQQEISASGDGCTSLTPEVRGYSRVQLRVLLEVDHRSADGQLPAQQ